MQTLPILWSFRRCPYAMRARMALWICGHRVEIREILLRDKPDAFLSISRDKTVPVLVCTDGTILQESRDIIFWACEHSDAGQSLLAQFADNSQDNSLFLDRLEGEFKTSLDRYKYSARYTDDPAEAAESKYEHRDKASQFIWEIEKMLAAQPYISGGEAGIVDIATWPFIRQFRIADPGWFDAQKWGRVQKWLNGFLNSELFAQIMHKYAPWQEADTPLIFGAE